MATTRDHSHGAEMPAGVTIALAATADLPTILRVQQAAFRRVARALDIDPAALPPLRETLEDLQRLMAAMRFFIAIEGDDIVATVRAESRPDRVVEVGRLAVDDGYERRGIASAIMAALEDSHADASRFELFTGADARSALALYDKLGYAIFRRTWHGPVEIVWLAKDRTPPA